MSKHTPTPWDICNGTDIFSACGSDSGDGVCCDDNDGWQVAEVGYYKSFVDGELVELGEGVRRANIRHIVHCVNNHERLVEMLGKVLNMYPWSTAVEAEARALLAQLEAEKGGE